METFDVIDVPKLSSDIENAGLLTDLDALQKQIDSLPDGRKITLQSLKELTPEQIQAQVKKILNNSTQGGTAGILVRDSQNPHIQSFLKTFKLADQVKSRMADLGDSLDLVRDPAIKQYVESKLDNFVQTRKVSYKDMEEMEMLVDAANEFSGQYSHFRNASMTGELKEFSNISKFNKYLKAKENIDVDDLLNNEALPAQFVRKGSISLKRDLNKEPYMYSMRQYVKNYPDSQMSDYLYKQYLNTYKQYPAVVEKMESLNQKYNVKVFIPSRFSAKMYDQVMNYLDKELEQWKKSKQRCSKNSAGCGF